MKFIIPALVILAGVSATFADQRCTARKGTCQNTSRYCRGQYVSGLCSGAWNRRCCVPSGSQGGGRCTVRRFTNSYFVGKRVYIDDGFRRSLDIVSGHARACGVKVYVTHSWRKLGATVGGAIVTPASNSNHLVGHAIDFNLIGSSFCNSRCMQENYRKSGNNPYKCFLTKVMRSGLRWGGVWSRKDPVHIDDYYNRNLASYRNLRTSLQAACKHVPM